MKYSPSQYAHALYYSLLDGEKDTVITNFASLLRKHHALKKLPSIISVFKTLTDTTNGKARMHITSATPMTPVIHNNILTTNHIDTSIGAGAKIVINDTRIDNTLRRRLADLRARITQ